MAKKRQKKEIRQLLRAAATNGNLSQREFQKILDAGGKADRVLERAVANKGLTIGSKVVNNYNAGKYTDPRDQFVRSMSDKVFRPGFGVSPIIQQIRTAGRLDPKSTLFISKRGSTSTVLPKGLNTGGTKTTKVRQDPINTDPINTDPIDPYNPEPMGSDFTGDVGSFDSGYGDMGSDGGLDSNMLQGGTLGGGEGMGSAMGIKARKSSRKQAGVSTKGTSQLNRNSLKIPLNFK